MFGKSIKNMGTPKSTTMSFMICNHTSPPTPRPSGNAYAQRCFDCQNAYAKLQSRFNIDTYNSLIAEATSNTAGRAVKVSNERDKREIIELGKRKVRDLKGNRNGEVERLWHDVGRTWSGATRIAKGKDGVVGGPGGTPGGEERLSVVLEKTREWLTKPRLVWKDGEGKVVSEVVLEC